MSSLDVRSNSAVMKRAEQLKRWEESDTNQEPSTPRPEKGRKIKFSSGCVFLAACLSGDKEEVLKLIENGADINTANVDGLTALHQACIDDNLEMVEFLVEHNADINRQDNEGWTPLHATASCGFVSIARYLVEHGANVSAVNSDGDLAVDLAVDSHHLPMIEFMQKMVNKYNIDCDEARRAEEQLMLKDAKKWLRSDASEVDRPHPKTGATALHVAAAKGYTKVLSLLLAGRANVDKQDNDGWTPLHASAHWGQKEAAEMLVDAMADIDIRNFGGQTCIDVAERKMVKFLEELRIKRIKRRPSSQIRISETIENNMENTPTKIKRVDMKPDQPKDLISDAKQNSQSNDPLSVEEEAPWRRNSLAARIRCQNETQIKHQVPDVSSKENTGVNTIATTNTDASSSTSSSINPTSASTPSNISTNNSTEASDVLLRRTQSFEHDEKLQSKSFSLGTSTASVSSTPNKTTPVRRSFAPPVRDEESETQRKLHAKRVRETRRSTQGVTLDEIKSAEEMVKKKNSSMGLNNNNNNNTTSFKLDDPISSKTYQPNSSAIIQSAPAVIAAANLSSTVGQRRINSTSGTNSNYSSNQSLNSVGRPVSAPVDLNCSTTTATSASTLENSVVTSNKDRLPIENTNNTNRRLNSITSPVTLSLTSSPAIGLGGGSLSSSAEPVKPNDLNDNDKENDNRSPLATQAVIQRRRKPKRRSTGVVHLDMDDPGPERQDSATDKEEQANELLITSGNERSSRSQVVMIGGTSGMVTAFDTTSSDTLVNFVTNDYKVLWEAVKLENEKLKQQLNKKDDELIQTRATFERITNATTKNSLSEIEKRERRAMERKLSEMEEELKLLQKLKTENERLRAENRALTRVVSKLTTSAQSQLTKSK